MAQYPAKIDLPATVTTDTSSGTGGLLTRTYEVVASKVEYLAAGERRIDTFDVTVKDGHGGDVTRAVAVTITGTNDGATLPMWTLRVRSPKL
jgi:VCBS repeat-containing protein